ncbi:LysR family transcriptional regulator [Pseudomonas leptonychotis]|uniref:LysR family transcriptional regulator n=1 Tax=Pseudomonas leptonychotis TaxID=2448482 RepID=UPI00386502FB
MDRLLAMRVFTRIVELQAFGKAADSLALPRASVTQLIKQLEAHLGAALLQRTTRHVSPTLDGQAYYQRCVALLAELDELEGAFAEGGTNPHGKLRVDLPASLAQRVIVPALADFVQRYPQIELMLGANDRPVDLIREGVDCVLRAGEVHDTRLAARPIANLRQVTCASADYLQKNGTPASLAELQGHQAVNFFSALTERCFALEFIVEGALVEMSLPARISTSSAEAYVAACEAGLGIIQVPHYHVRKQLEQGRLHEILVGFAPPDLPLTALYPPHRQLSPRVRVFIDWLIELFAVTETR